jgi:hypothetical protein
MSKPLSDAKNPRESGSSFLAEIRGSAAGEAPAPAAHTGRRFSSTYILAAVMTVLSAGTLLGMRAYGKQSGIRIDKFDTEGFKPVRSETVTAAQTQRVLAELERHGTPLQIPAEVIPKKVFVLGSGAPAVDNSGKLSAEADRRAREAAEKEAREREAVLADKLRSLEVTAVVMGQRPVVRVSGKLYRVGDTIAKTFAVLEITERGVRLGFEGAEYELTIKQALNSDGSRPEGDEQTPRR